MLKRTPVEAKSQQVCGIESLYKNQGGKSYDILTQFFFGECRQTATDVLIRILDGREIDSPVTVQNRRSVVTGELFGVVPKRACGKSRTAVLDRLGLPANLE